MFFQEICKPRISDFGKGGRISFTSLLCIMEDAGSHHSTYAGDDVLEGSLGGSAWVNTNWRIRIIKPPAGMKDLYVATWARTKSSGATVLRDYTISTASGRELVLAEAKFVRLDLATGKPVRITDELYDRYEPEERAVFEDEMPRLVPPDHFDGQQSVVLRKSDIDFNGHVHNTRYPDIAAAGVPETVFDLMKAAEINIAYRKALKETDTVNIAYTMTGEGCFVSIHNEQGACCYIQAV